MKKIYLIVLAMLIIFINFAFADDHPFYMMMKGGLDLNGKHKVNFLGESGEEDVKIGFCGGLETIVIKERNYVWGFGGEYQIPRSQEDFQGNFSFIPIYCFLNITFQSDARKNEMVPFLIGKIGYNFFTGDDDYKGTGDYAITLRGGIYYGGGFGIMLGKSFSIESIYSVNNGKGEFLDETIDIRYSKFTIYLGIILK